MSVSTLPNGARALLAAALCILALSGCAGTSPDKRVDQGVPAAKVQSDQITPAMLALPEAAYESGRYNDALHLYRELLVRDPNNVHVKLGIADCELASDDLIGADELYRQLEGESSIHALVQQGHGIALLRLGQDAPAEKALKDAVAADPKLWRAWNALGALYDSNQKWGSADQAYAKALALVPRSAVVNNNLGFSLLSQGKLKEAVQNFQTALGIDPTLQPAQMNLRIALALDGRYDEATAGAQGATLSATLNNVGFAAMARGDYGKAESYFTKSVNASSSYEETASKNLEELKVISGKGAGGRGGT